MSSIDPEKKVPEELEELLQFLPKSAQHLQAGTGQPVACKTAANGRCKRVIEHTQSDLFPA
jgi:hypothetical protein